MRSGPSGLWFDPDEGRGGSWIADTRRLDETVDAKTVVYYTRPGSGMIPLSESDI